MNIHYNDGIIRKTRVQSWGIGDRMEACLIHLYVRILVKYVCYFLVPKMCTIYWSVHGIIGKIRATQQRVASWDLRSFVRLHVHER